MILAAAVVKESHSNRDLYLYDAFEMIPGYGGHKWYLYNSQEDVEHNFDLFSLLNRNIHFVKGFFLDTVSQWTKGKPIAVLHVHENFYDSYSDIMYAMYEDVAVGRIVIFDDVMSHRAVMNFWVDFINDQGIKEELNRIDKHSAWFRKRDAVQIDSLKKHPPQDVRPNFLFLACFTCVKSCGRWGLIHPRR
jgi:hypothetical protein